MTGTVRESAPFVIAFAFGSYGGLTQDLRRQPLADVANGRFERS